jgi:hypothetical protein
MKALAKKLISVAVVLSMALIMGTAAFAENDVIAVNSTPVITDVQSNDYLEWDGTFVSEVTFYENGVFSSIVKIVEPDGAYTVTVEQGDYYDVLEGQYENYLPPSAPPLSASGAQSSVASAASWSYSLWGTDNYTVNVLSLQSYATAAGIAAILAGAFGLQTAALALGIASLLIGQIANYYSTYGTNTIYFHEYKYLGIESITSGAIYHHKVYSYAYNSSSYSSSTLITSEYDEYSSIYFMF